METRIAAQEQVLSAILEQPTTRFASFNGTESGTEFSAAARPSEKRAFLLWQPHPAQLVGVARVGANVVPKWVYREIGHAR